MISKCLVSNSPPSFTFRVGRGITNYVVVPISRSNKGSRSMAIYRVQTPKAHCFGYSRIVSKTRESGYATARPNSSRLGSNTLLVTLARPPGRFWNKLRSGVMTTRNWVLKRRVQLRLDLYNWISADYPAQSCCGTRKWPVQTFPWPEVRAKQDGRDHDK